MFSKISPKVKAWMPWWLKIICKICISKLPLDYAWFRKHNLIRHGQMDSIHYCFRTFNFHLCTAGIEVSELKDKVVLELGPGDSIGTSILSYCYGASSILVNGSDSVVKNPGFYKEFASDLSNYGLAGPCLRDLNSFEEVLDACDAEYMAKGLESLKSIPSKSVDFIFSQAVLEHIRRHEFHDTMVECRRILKDNGVCSHQVDLKDHLSGGLNNLRFSHSTWESDLWVNSNFYTNRLRLSQIIDLMTQADFRVDVTRVSRWDSPVIARSDLPADFAHLSDNDLSIKSFDIVLRPNLP